MRAVTESNQTASHLAEGAYIMSSIAWFVGLAWGICGAAAAFTSGRPGLWRVTIWLGPLAFLLFPPKDR
jgi:hypothetical protein